jgi:hypothetical protein
LKPSIIPFSFSLGTSPHFTTIVVDDVALASTPRGPNDGTVKVQKIYNYKSTVVLFSFYWCIDY